MIDAVACWRPLRRFVSALTAGLLLSGCQSWILQPDTVDMAGTVGPIYMRQAVQNLADFVNDPDTLPSQIEIGAGEVTLSSDIDPKVTLPFGNQVVRGAGNIISSVTDPYRTFELGGGVTRGGKWNVTAVSDPVRIKNLAALYRYATTGKLGNLVEEYSLPTKVLDGKLVVDPGYRGSPLCVFCPELDTNVKPNPDNLNPMLRFAGALISNKPVPGGVNLTRYGKSDLWMSKDNADAHRLTDFVLFLLPLALVPVTATATPAK